jgi:hypothetical protein
MRVSGLRHAPADLPPGIECSVANEKKKGLGGTQSQFGQFGQQKFRSSFWESTPDSSAVPPVA